VVSLRQARRRDPRTSSSQVPRTPDLHRRTGGALAMEVARAARACDTAAHVSVIHIGAGHAAVPGVRGVARPELPRPLGRGELRRPVKGHGDERVTSPYSR
jgi:hypothetical protein